MELGARAHWLWPQLGVGTWQCTSYKNAFGGPRVAASLSGGFPLIRSESGKCSFNNVRVLRT